MQRREFVALLGGAVVWPLAASAQSREPMRRIGILMHSHAGDPEGQSRLAAILQGLKELGWTAGGNITIDVRWGMADPEAMKRFGKELVDLQPDLVMTTSTPATAAVLQQSRTIPVVFVLVADPVGSGFVASLARPGGNATGFSPITGSLGGRWAELLKEIAPRITRVTLLFNPVAATYVDSYLKPFKAAAASLGMEAIVAPVDDMRALDSRVAGEASNSNSGLVVIPDAFTEQHRAEIVSLVVRHRLPAINWARGFADDGGLISYGPYLVEEHRRAASYADRILKGEKPGELPVEAPRKYQLVINLKAAKALGLTVPQPLLVAADERIE